MTQIIPRNRSLIVLIGVLVLVGVSSAFAVHKIQAAALSGVVKDRGGAPVSDATIFVGEVSATADSLGAFRIDGLSQGEHLLRILVAGQEVHSEAVQISDAQVHVDVVASRVQVGWDSSNLEIGTVPAGWYVTSGTGWGIFVEETSGLEAMRVPPSTRSRAYFMFDEPVTDRVQVAFLAYTPTTLRSLAVSLARQLEAGASASNSWGPYITVHDDTILTSYVDGIGWIEYTPIDGTKWNEYLLDVRVGALQYDIYVNGVLVGTSDFRRKHGEMNQMELGHWGPDNQEYTWVRNIRIIYP